MDGVAAATDTERAMSGTSTPIRLSTEQEVVVRARPTVPAKQRFSWQAATAALAWL